MEILRFSGLDLPIYPTDIVLDQLGFSDIGERTAAALAAEQHPDTTFIRTAEPFRNYYNEDLRSRLDHTDKALRVVSDVCEVPIVEYTWGLCLDDGQISYNRKYLGGLLPPGYLLVAEVEIILPAANGPDTTQQHVQALKRYQKGEKKLRSIQSLTKIPNLQHQPDFEDYDGSQTMFGSRASQPNTAPALWFIDIEPIRL